MAGSDDPRLPPETTVGEIELEWLVNNGLAPLAYRLRPPEGYGGTPRAAARLHSADLTSRVLTRHLLDEVEGIVSNLHGAGIEPTLLKGVSYATRYYPEAHLRTMGDVDLLLPGEAVPRAERMLHEMGFSQPPSPWPNLHHAPPLHHEDKQIWVELHHALLRSTSPAATTPPFNLADIENEQRTTKLGHTTVQCLSPECELAYIAAAWCYDLSARFGQWGMQRSLVDAVYLLRHCEGAFDWNKVLRWSHETMTGACLGILLTYLQRHGAYPGPRKVPTRLMNDQSYVSGGSLGLIHAIVDRYVMRYRRFGRVVTANNLGSALDALIARRPAWRNVLAVPYNVAFPRRSPKRFHPRFILWRLASLIRVR